MSKRNLLSLMLAFIILTATGIAALAAGGLITGTVTDPNGSAVLGATVTAVNSADGKSVTATTDKDGHYSFEGLPAGDYTVTITGKGFVVVRRDGIKVEDGKTAALDVKLVIALADTGVIVSAKGSIANTETLYQQLRQKTSDAGAFSGDVATVNNLVLKRDAATYTLRSGEIYFLKPIAGRYTGAVFLGEGEIELVPPTDIEKSSLAIFTDEPRLKEEFTDLVLRFTDGTFDEVRQSPNATMRSGGAQAARALDKYKNRENELRKDLRTNLDTRTLADLYAPKRPGYFMSFIGGRRFDKLLYVVDPLGVPDVSPEEVMLLGYSDSTYGIWTAFHLAGEYQQGIATSAQDHRWFDITRHDIDAVISGTRITATDKVTFKALLPEMRVLPFDLYPALRVSRVQDEAGNDLNIIQEDKDRDAGLAVVYPRPLEVGKTYTLTFEYSGTDALRDSGGGNFILLPRSTWYPNNAGTQFGDRAIFEMTFRYPKKYTFVGTGAQVGENKEEGDVEVTHWSSGTTELAVAGFNYGRFKKKELADKDSGYNIEFYANQELPAEMVLLQRQVEELENQGVKTGTTLGAMSTTGMAGAAIADAQNSTRVYNYYFGKLPYTRVAMTQQPAGFFGQAWPTLVFMPYTAFIDSTLRTQLYGVRGGTDDFWKYVGPHEVAHQWWGHLVGWDSYHDQWMSEGFAEFSASLYIQTVLKNTDRFTDFWEGQRRLIIEATPGSKGRKPYTVGPVTQGYRLNNARTGNIARVMIYPKGAYILHMLRMLMYDPKTGDDRFRAMMQDFIKSHYNQDVSTEDFKSIVEKHMTPQMDLGEDGKMDWFFNQWVYGTEVPAYRFDYQIGKSADGRPLLTGRITQSGVSDNFRMGVPVYLDFGKGWVRLGVANITGNTTVELGNVILPAAPKKAAICALADVLATDIQNSK